MRNETVQAWLLGKLVHEGLDAPPTGADRNAMNEFIRAVTKDASYKYQAGGEHKPSVWVQNYPQHATLIRGALVDALDIFALAAPTATAICAASTCSTFWTALATS